MVKFAITLFCAQVVNLDFDAEAVPAGEELGDTRWPWVVL